MASASTDAAEIRRRGRQRLIGAIAIVLLLVVFVPMLLDSEPRKPADEPPLDIPSKDNVPPLPAPGAVAPAQAGAQSASVAPAQAGAQSASVAPAQAGAQSASVAPAKAGAQSDGTPASPAVTNPPKLEGFAVQVGAFRDEAKLKSARDKLAAAGIPHYTERLQTSNGALTRLRAGPFPSRQAADAAAAKLKENALPSQVVTLP